MIKYRMVLSKALVFTDTKTENKIKKNYMPPIINKEKLTNMN